MYQLDSMSLYKLAQIEMIEFGLLLTNSYLTLVYWSGLVKTNGMPTTPGLAIVAMQIVSKQALYPSTQFKYNRADIGIRKDPFMIIVQARYKPLICPVCPNRPIRKPIKSANQQLLFFGGSSSNSWLEING